MSVRIPQSISQRPREADVLFQTRATSRSDSHRDSGEVATTLVSSTQSTSTSARTHNSRSSTTQVLLEHGQWDSTYHWHKYRPID